MKKISVVAVLALCAVAAVADVNVRVGGAKVTVGRDINVSVDAKDVSTVATDDGSTASVTVGGVESGTNIKGVTVINGKVWIDGTEIPPGVKRHKSKSGTVYLIERKNGAVSVTNE